MNSQAEYARIAAKHTPPGIRVRLKRRQWILRGEDAILTQPLKPAHACIRRGEILAPKPDTIEALAFYVHECGHFRLRHFSRDETDNAKLRWAYCSDRPPRTIAEMEAECEKWTLATLRLEGLVVPRYVIGLMREYVAQCVDDDTAKRKSPRYVRRWIG